VRDARIYFRMVIALRIVLNACRRSSPEKRSQLQRFL
jgi:hypothetical protein